MNESNPPSPNSVTRDQKEIALISLLEKKNLIDVNRLKSFKPNPGFQEKFLLSKKRIKLACVGNQGGKTHVGAVLHALYALGEHPTLKIRTPNKGIIVVAKSFKDGIQDEIVPKILEVVGSKDIKQIKNNSRGEPATIFWRTGSVTYLTSAEQEDVTFESKTLHHAWIDEPVRRQIYVALLRGMLTTRGHIFMTCTPLDEPWIYEDIYMAGMEHKDPDIEVFEGSSDENKCISAQSKKETLSKLTADEIETRWYGKFRHLSGRVFKEYSPEKLRIPSFDIPYHWPVWVAIDPHPEKPHAVLFLAVSPQNIKYVVNEIYIRCTIEQLAKHILEIGGQYRIINYLIDTSAQQDGWGKVSARQILDECGVPTKLAQKKNLKKSGIMLINQYFKNEELFVMEHCLRTHRELTNQVYKQNKRDKQKVLEEPEKKFDDMCDCLRYALVERPDYSGESRVYEREVPYQRVFN